MIKPSIGRIVWYQPHDDEDMVRHDQPHAAIVVSVLDDEHVNLAMFDANGVARTRGGVFLFGGEGDRPKAPFAEWMPFQLGQAKAQEADKKVS